MPTAVVNNAMLQCTCGDAPTPLTVTSQATDKIEGQLIATIMDFAPTTNIKPFGTCKTLTAAASGTPTPCVPATVAPWSPGSTSTCKVGGFPGLLNTDKLSCTVGGMISITDSMVKKTNET